MSSESAAGPRVLEVRRCSDPVRAQQLWDGVRCVRAQKQIPAIARMARYMNRFYKIKKDETQRLLDAAVEDNLIKLERKLGTKGSKSGVEEKAYRLPTADMLPRERHDWYCFHCHAPGEVLLCDTCHRVYHEACVKAAGQASVDDEAPGWTCSICKVCQSVPENYNKRERKDLNHLLSILCGKLKQKMPDLLLAREVPQMPCKPPGPMGGTPNAQSASVAASGPFSPAMHDAGEKLIPPPEEDDSWRASFLLKQQIDFEEIEQKCASNQYRVADEFRADCQLIVHDMVIYHGVHSANADLGKQMLRDCVADLKEIQQCRDCYRYANENREKYWFCKPCRPFHELVYAKQKGFPYWPAKVISSAGGVYEVRFFGGYHQKAQVEKQHVRPITVNVHTLQVKRTSLWNKACEEMRKYQELLGKVKADPSFLKDPYGNPFESGDIRVELGGKDGASASEGEDSGTEDNGLGPESEVKARRDEEETKAEEAEEEEEPPAKQVKIAPVIEQVKRKRGRPPKKQKKEEADDHVSSSSQELRHISAGVQTSPKLLKKIEEQIVEKLRAEFEQEKKRARAEFDQEKKRAVNVATRSLERDLERLKADHATEIEELNEKHSREILENKRKQWCFCEAEAIYTCCWNTAYCSVECQHEHWYIEHRRRCQRKKKDFMQ